MRHNRKLLFRTNISLVGVPKSGKDLCETPLAIISNEQVAVTISNNLDNIHSCDKLDSLQSEVVLSNTQVGVNYSYKSDNTSCCCKLPGCQREIIKMMVTTSTTTLDWILAATT